ncbi:Glycine/D-amino acid oxidase [Octadecabacter temperatus]|uniref:4-methylaminobutanoate oxidase (Formaldehyde-forming) n=1 Tax=Octadecabacter temperatus TaxID=1458307 RepID=A0A0K0Y5C5_9RHOB|nr:FAD-dependent oxidoreductase [Octadecabacter temperatus]AKS46188.1 4-methylaminobutanoate oxidase (formaldehyde-forming) [Octadecabacter temperatus]SIO09279.1 Glycine/D-amino acid oxidase [Octadecabacter temperatus]
MKVIVVGAGIIGATIAYNLSRDGADVTVVTDQSPSATQASFGWINASFYADEVHHRLRVTSMAAYGRLMDTLPSLPIQMNGALWWEEQGDGLTALQDALLTLGYPVERLDSVDVSALEPELRGLPDVFLRFPSEGDAEPDALAAALLKASGAHVVTGVRVKRIIENNGMVCGVETQMGIMAANKVIVAAGNGAPEILASVDVALPMLVRPGALVATKPISGKVSSVLVTPNGEARQLPDGRILASAVASHQSDSSDKVIENAVEIAVRVLAWLDPLIGDERLEWDCVSLAYRPVPEDGLPVIGRVGLDGLYVAVMHSGVTLAAITGEAIAADVLGKGDAFDALLAPYRPSRFQ